MAVAHYTCRRRLRPLKVVERFGKEATMVGLERGNCLSRAFLSTIGTEYIQTYYDEIKKELI